MRKEIFGTSLVKVHCLDAIQLEFASSVTLPVREADGKMSPTGAIQLSLFGTLFMTLFGTLFMILFGTLFTTLFGTLFTTLFWDTFYDTF